MKPEWHVMLAMGDRKVRIVGRVEAVDVRGITITRLERPARRAVSAETFVPWEEIRRIVMSGPDHDDDLFQEAHGQAERPPAAGGKRSRGRLTNKRLLG